MDNNNVELTGEVSGNFYPSTQSELLRSLVLRGPFLINGGVFAQNITNIGHGTVTGPVLATEEITLEGSHIPGKPLRFLSGINATMSIAILETGKPPEESVVSDLNKAGIVVNGDITSNYLKLENTLVFGNLRAKQISLVNSIILGSIFADELLRIEDSVFGSFQVGKAKIVGKNGCWLPFAISRTPFEFERTETDNSIAEIYYLPITSGGNTESYVVNYYAKLHNPNARIFPSDIFQDYAEDGELYYFLNIAKRALNFHPIEKDVNKIKRLLNEMLIFEHFDLNSQEETAKDWPKVFGKEELQLLNMAFAT